MKISNINLNRYTLNFSKTLKGVGAIQTTLGQEEVKIYQLDEFEDQKDLKTASKLPIWRGSFYLNDTAAYARNYIEEYNVYTMENHDGDVICYSIVDDNRSKETRLKLIETAPKYSCYNRLQRSAKYIGETMMAFIAASSEGKNFTISEVADRPKTKDFYYKGCKFVPHKTQGAILPSTHLSRLIDKNANHTGKKIEIIL